MRTRMSLLGALLGVLVFAVSGAARAEVLGAELEVSGMSCPFCAFGIEKKLRAVQGVRDVTVFLDVRKLCLSQLLWVCPELCAPRLLKAARGEAEEFL